jgi:hypothetical protein
VFCFLRVFYFMLFTELAKFMPGLCEFSGYRVTNFYSKYSMF